MKLLRNFIDWLFITFGGKCPVCNKPSTHGTTCSEECYQTKEYYEDYLDNDCPSCGRYYLECTCNYEEEPSTYYEGSEEHLT